MADAAAPKKRGRPAKSAESKEAKEVPSIFPVVLERDH